MMRIPSRLCVRWLALFTFGAPACAGLALAAPPAPGAAPASGQHAWEAGDTPAALESWVNAHLQRADAAVARLLAVKGPRTVDNTVATYDEALSDLIDTQAQSQVLYGVGATKELRDKAQALTQKASAAATALNLNPAVYKALSAVPQPADPGVRHYLERTLLEYRLAGVDRDEATRAQIKALQDQITERGLAFERTVHDDVRSIMVEPSQLAGLPPDFLATHKPDASGKVKITTDPPDALPGAEVRRQRGPAPPPVARRPPGRLPGQHRAAAQPARGAPGARAPTRLCDLGGLRDGGPDDRLAGEARAVPQAGG